MGCADQTADSDRADVAEWRRDCRLSRPPAAQLSRRDRMPVMRSPNAEAGAAGIRLARCTTNETPSRIIHHYTTSGTCRCRSLVVSWNHPGSDTAHELEAVEQISAPWPRNCGGSWMSMGDRSTRSRLPSLRESLQRWSANVATSEWEFVVRTAMYVPIAMRRRRADGTWESRDATEEEIQQFLESEAW
jgi:hypothetical protein